MKDETCKNEMIINNISPWFKRSYTDKTDKGQLCNNKIKEKNKCERKGTKGYV